MNEKPLSVNKVKEAFFSLTMNKSAGFDEISLNVVKKCFGELINPLKDIFELSLSRVFSPKKWTTLVANY